MALCFGNSIGPHLQAKIVRPIQSDYFRTLGLSVYCFLADGRMCVHGFVYYNRKPPLTEGITLYLGLT